MGDLLLVAADAEQASGVTLCSPCAAAQVHGYLDHIIGHIFVQSNVKRFQNGVFHILHMIRGRTRDIVSTSRLFTRTLALPVRHMNDAPCREQLTALSGEKLTGSMGTLLKWLSELSEFSSVPGPRVLDSGELCLRKEVLHP
jgi:hypothetical protein